MLRESLLLLRKDVRHFRLPLAAFLALVGLLGWAEAATPRRPEFAVAAQVCQWLLLPGAWYLLVLAIHEQKLPGDRQYWLTRPYSRGSLVLAKALFAVVFLNLPLLAIQAVALALNGLGPLEYLRALAARQFFFTALVVLPAAALATVTTSLAQFAIGAFSAFGVVLVIELGGGKAPGRWGGIDWIESSAVAVLACAVFGGIVALQYSRRQTWFAASGLALGVVICAALPALDFWSGAFGLQTWLAARNGEAAGPQLRFAWARDPAEGRAMLPRYIEQPDLAPIALPVELGGIPKGMAALSERAAAAIDAPGGVSWNSGWQAPLVEPRALRRDGTFWLSLLVDRGLLQRIQNNPVSLRLRAAFTLFGAPSITLLPVPAGDRWVPGVGFCWTSPARFSCFSPFAHAAWVEAEARPAPPAAAEPVPLRPEISYALFPTAAGFGLWQTDVDAMWMRPMPWKEIAVQTRRAQAHFERDLEIPALRLAAYAAAAGTTP